MTSNGKGPKNRAVRRAARGWIRRADMAFRRATAGTRLLPDFVIIGAQRAGTTSLYHGLARHPCIGPSERKEVHFFDVNFSRGELWYRAHFPTRAERRLHRLVADQTFVTGEACPYYLFHPQVPARLRSMLPEAKLLVLLRNPADRAISHYHHEKQKGREHLTLDEAIAREAERIDAESERLAREPHAISHSHRNFSYVARGRYAEQLERWLRWFPRERILVLSSEEFFASPNTVYPIVLDFLGLPPWNVDDHPRLNSGHYGNEEEARERLVHYFRPHNERLYALLGRDLGWDRAEMAPAPGAAPRSEGSWAS